jgi:hypothetical protein
MIQIAAVPEVEVQAAIHRRLAAQILVRQNQKMTKGTKTKKNLESSSTIDFFNLMWTF